MLKRIRSLPSPALAIAVLALIVAVGGGSFALAKRGGLNHKIAKISSKVANKRITKRAPKLSVNYANSAGTASNASHTDNASHADNAGHADNASHADSATTATNADNATTLNGEQSSAYLGRVAQASSDESSLPLTGSTLTDGTPGGGLAITVPNGVGFVMVNATASFTSPSAAGIATVLWVNQDEACTSVGGFGYKNRVYGSLDNTTNNRDELVQNLVYSVTPGSHTFHLCLYESGGNSTILARALTLTTIPRGANG